MILVSIFSEDNVLSDQIKIWYIFEYQSNENRAFRFFGTPGIASEGETEINPKKILLLLRNFQHAKKNAAKVMHNSRCVLKL